MENYLTRAIRKLKPNAEFSYTDNDYSTIKWDVLEGNAPTESEINAAIKQVKTDEINKAATRAAQRETILDRLGLTEQEAALLLS